MNMKKPSAFPGSAQTLALAMSLMSLMSVSAIAETTPATPSNVSKKVASSNILKQLTFAYWSNFAGPGLQSGSYQPGIDGQVDKTSPLKFDLVLTGGYKFTDSISVGPVVEFAYVPFFGHDMTFKDPALRVNHSQLIKVATFKMAADLRVIAPGSLKSRDNNAIGGLRSTQNLTYEIPGTKLTLGYYSYLRAYAFTDGEVIGKPMSDRTIYGAPNASYELSPKVQLTVWNDLLQLKHSRSDGFFSYKNDPVDIEPGVNWDITPQISFNPYINIYTDNPTLNSSQVGFILTGKLL